MSSGKKGKTGKQRRDDSESFDSRSQYTPFYHHPQQATWVPPQFIPYNAAQIPLHQQPVPPEGLPQQQAPPFGMQPQIVYGPIPLAYPPGAPSNGHVPSGGMPLVRLCAVQFSVVVDQRD